MNRNHGTAETRFVLVSDGKQKRSDAYALCTAFQRFADTAEYKELSKDEDGINAANSAYTKLHKSTNSKDEDLHEKLHDILLVARYNLQVRPNTPNTDFFAE